GGAGDQGLDHDERVRVSRPPTRIGRGRLTMEDSSMTISCTEHVENEHQGRASRPSAPEAQRVMRRLTILVLTTVFAAGMASRATGADDDLQGPIADATLDLSDDYDPWQGFNEKMF